MSKILRRPMFRGGPVDSRGTGITSGLMDGGRVGLESSFPGTVGDAEKSLNAYKQNLKNMDNFPFMFNLSDSFNSNDKTSVVGVEDQSQEKVVDDKGSVIEDSILDTDFDQTETVDGKTVVKPRKEFVGNEPGIDETTSTFFKGLTEPGQSAEYAAAKAKYKDGVVQGRNLEEDAILSQAAYEAAAKEKLNIPEINLDNDTADTEISAKDAVRANQELFADLLGKSKARGQDISDMLLRFSGAEGDTVGEKFKAFTKAEAKAGKSRTEKINETAGALAIKDFMGGRAAERQAEVMKSKIDYDYGKKGELVNVQPTDDVQTALFKISKKADVPANSDAAIKYLIGIKKDTNRVFRNDKVKIKDLSKPNKLKKLQTGYNIIEEDGVKNIVLYDGSGNVEGIQVFSIGELWKS